MQEVEVVAISKKNKSVKIKDSRGKEEWIEGTKEQINSLEKGQKVLIETQGKKIKKLIKKLEEKENEEKRKEREEVDERIKTIREQKIRIASVHLALQILAKEEKFTIDDVLKVFYTVKKQNCGMK
jgi:hypothetical protein